MKRAIYIGSLSIQSVSSLKRLVVCFTIFCTQTISAQDPHLSQFFYTPLLVNPANTGVFNGDLRVSTTGRSQWFTATKPYSTSYASIDAPILRSKSNKNDFFAIGFNVMNDKQGSGNLTTMLYSGLMSFTKYVGGKKDNYLSVGFSGTYGTKTAGLDALQFDSQYDPNSGGYSAAYGTNEQNMDKSIFFDVSTGLLWNFGSDRKWRHSLGLSAHHITAPNVSIMGRLDKLLRKYSFQWNAAYRLGTNTNAELAPNLLVSYQGKSILINAGANIKYILQERSRYTNFHNERSMSIGAYYRFRDAAYVNLRLDFEDFAFGVAYDINISGLTPATKSIGSIELTLQYRGAFGFNKDAKRASTQFLY